MPIDRVVVRKVDEDKYMVLEGNRRICAAKQVTGFSEDGAALSKDVMATLEQIQCLLYTGADDGNKAAWIFQGLRHITGISEWPAFNKAKLLVDEMEKGGCHLPMSVNALVSPRSAQPNGLEDITRFDRLRTKRNMGIL